MSFLSRLLGNGIKRHPYLATVTYEGTVATFPMWGADMREALTLTIALMPQMDTPPLRIEIVKQ